MAVETHAFNIIILKAIGDISEKKIKQVSQLGYKLIVNMNNLVVHFTELETSNTVLLSQQQIVYGAIAANVNSLMQNPEQAINSMEKVLDALLLDNQYILQVKLERSY